MDHTYAFTKSCNVFSNTLIIIYIYFSNSILKNYCNSNDIPFVDYFSSMADDKGGLKVPEYTAANDLVHPNLAGYKVMEKIILKALN